MKEVDPCVFVWIALLFPWILTRQEAECWPTDNTALCCRGYNKKTHMNTQTHTETLSADSH